MLTRDPAAFVRHAQTLLPDHGPACAKGAFIVSPEGFALAAQSAEDNRYMDLSRRIDPERALTQHRRLKLALSRELPTLSFPGDPRMPDAVFPNNVFATVPGRLIIGQMRHPVRQAEAERRDIRDFFTRLLGYEVVDLREQPGIGELTGSLVIDRARGLGFCGLSARCDMAGAEAMHAAFGLRATLVFDLAESEYHANVVMSVLASRALVIAPDGFADEAVAEAVAALYPAVIRLSEVEKCSFAGNCIALGDERVWMSEAAEQALSPDTRRAFADAGFAIGKVALDEIEKSGGSLRCCVAEIF